MVVVAGNLTSMKCHAKTLSIANARQKPFQIGKPRAIDSTCNGAKTIGQQPTARLCQSL